MTGSGQGAPILQSHLPFTPWADPALARMPGMKPVEGSWIVADEARAAQLAERRRLLTLRRAQVCAILPRAVPAFAELLELVLAELRPRTVPDGAAAGVLCSLLQEDLLILQPEGDTHVLTGGVLCFPASWTLAEKIGRPLARIHAPVAEYDARLAGQVDRLFDRVPVGRAMWRANALGYASADLYQPRPEAAPKLRAPNRYLRCERQTVFRLPQSRAIVFAVHTYVVAPGALTPEQRASCPIVFG